MTYTTTTKISEELGGYTINTSSIPSSSTVEGWILEAVSEINEKTGMSWSVNTETDEVLDYDGSGVLRLNHAPIISIIKLENEVNGIGASSESWNELTEGRLSTNSFTKYSDEGELEFHTSTPRSGYQNMKVTYTWGTETVPLQVQRLATLMVAKRVTDSVINNSATNEGGSLSVGTISISDPSMFGLKHKSETNNEINSLFKTIGQFKTFRVNRRWN